MIINESIFPLTKKELQKIKELLITDSKPEGGQIEFCGCKGKKILIKAIPKKIESYEMDIEIKCMDCERTFKGYTTTIEDYIFVRNLVLEKKKALGI